MANVYHWLATEEAQFLAATFPALAKANGTNFPVSGLAYDAATRENAYWKFPAITYGAGNLTLTVYWYADTASSGDLIWGAQITAITPNIDTTDVETDTLATANTATDTHLGTTGQRLHSIDIEMSNLDSFQAIWSGSTFTVMPPRVATPWRATRFCLERCWLIRIPKESRHGD